MARTPGPFGNMEEEDKLYPISGLRERAAKQARSDFGNTTMDKVGRGAESIGQGIANIPGIVSSGIRSANAAASGLEDMPFEQRFEKELPTYRGAVSPSESEATKILLEPFGYVGKQGIPGTTPSPGGWGDNTLPSESVSGAPTSEGGTTSPWEKTVNREGGATYDLAGGEGTLTTHGWNPEGRGSFSVMPNAGGPLGGIPKTDAQLELAARQAGTYQGRSLADKEAESMGGIPHPGEFNYDNFRNKVRGMGVWDQPTTTKLFTQAIKEHEAQTKAYTDAYVARMQFGPGSPESQKATSALMHQNLLAAKHPAEEAKTLAEIFKLRSEAETQPAHKEYLMATADKLRNDMTPPIMKELAPYFTVYKQKSDGLSKAIGDPKSIKEEQDKLDVWMLNHVDRVTGGKAAGAANKSQEIWVRARKTLPELPDKPEVGKIYSTSRGNVRWTGSGLEVAQ